MPLICLTTKINATIQAVFDLSRDIDFHQKCASKTREKAVAGRTSDLINLGETVTWEAVHFGVKQQLTTKITEMNAPHSFTDEMVKGAFKSIRHEHLFHFDSAECSKCSTLTSNNSNCSCVTIMKDKFYFESPLGIFGKLFNRLVLKQYMTRFLEERNKTIKEYNYSKLPKN